MSHLIGPLDDMWLATFEFENKKKDFSSNQAQKGITMEIIILKKFNLGRYIN